KTLTAQGLLQQIENDPRPVFEICNNHEGLYGILLGFGRVNSLLFHRWDELEKSVAKTVPPFIPKITPSSEFDDIDAELRWFHDFFLGIWDYYSVNYNPFIRLLLLGPLGFRATDSAETRTLAKKYERAHDAISTI